MLRTCCRLLLPAAFLICTANASAQTKWPNTLLWRISGKGLTAPSYVYGTMHLQDKRLFQFGDSVYHALETTAGMATEVDFNEYLDSVMRNSFQQAEKNLLLEKEKVLISPKSRTKTSDSLLRMFGVKGNTANKSQLKKIREYRMTSLLKQGEMPTIVDAYLMGLARRQNKWIGGIEDVADQLHLSDELGADLQPETVLQPDAVFKTGIEKMVAIYVAQNLNDIDQFLNLSAHDKDLLLTRRNLKMARRMDSLSHRRTMFFAVGAAHLPGDSGVINLLRADGYAVEPVFSVGRTPADVYAAKLNNLQWVAVAGADSSYAVQMPGSPLDYNMFGELLKMKMFFDITTMSFYMIGKTAAPGVKPELLDEMLKNMADRFGKTQQPPQVKSIALNGIPGREGRFETIQGAYRVQLFLKDRTVFLLMAGGQKKEVLTSADATKFFASFVPGNTTVVSKPWVNFELPDKGVSVRWPGAPQPDTAATNKGPVNGWIRTSYQYVDAQTGLFYLMQVHDLEPGNFLRSDTGYFTQTNEQYAALLTKNLRREISRFNGLPLLNAEGESIEYKAYYKLKSIIRGHRVYIFLCGTPVDIPDRSDLDSFLNSIQVLPYLQAEYRQHSAEGFTTAAPSPFEKQPADTTDESPLFAASYQTYNSKAAVTYTVYKDLISPLYWATSDAGFFKMKVATQRNGYDTLLLETKVMNGSLPGVELLLKTPAQPSYRKVRMLVNKDTLYTLMSLIPEADLDSACHQTFFNHFRVTNEVAPTIYTSKAAVLLADLRSPDSITAATAYNALESAAFTSADLPLLYKGLLATYDDDDEYNGTKSTLVRVIAPLADRGTIPFVQTNYLLPGSNNTTAYHLLTLLAKLKTATAYTLLKQYLLQPLPASGNPAPLQYALDDSAGLTATLFPELLQQAGDSLLGSAVIITGAAKIDKAIKNGSEEYWYQYKWSQLLGFLNDAEGNHLLQTWLRTKEIFVKEGVIIALLKNNQPVAPAEILKVAADKGYRNDLYNDLQTIGKPALMPALYATQQSLAESELHTFLTDEEYEDFTLTYIGQQTAEYNGAGGLFCLFKVRMAYNDEDKKENFLAVAGPYKPGEKTKLTATTASGVYTDAPYTPEKKAKLLAAYLAQQAEYEK